MDLLFRMCILNLESLSVLTLLLSLLFFVPACSPLRIVGMHPDSLRFLCFTAVVLVPHIIGELIRLSWTTNLFQNKGLSELKYIIGTCLSFVYHYSADNTLTGKYSKYKLFLEKKTSVYTVYKTTNVFDPNRDPLNIVMFPLFIVLSCMY